MIEIDVNSVIPPAALATFDVETIRQAMIDVAEAARNEWIKLSMSELRSSQQEYTKGISGVIVEGDLAYIQLHGVFPNMIEQGFDPFDLRDTLLGPNVPVSAPGEPGKHESKDGGYYRTIMFRMMGSKTTGRNAQRVTDVYASEMGSERAAKLGRIAERRMRKLAASVSNPGGKTAWGESLSVPPGDKLDVRGHGHVLRSSGFDIAGTSHGGAMEKVGLHQGAEHKNSIFEGAHRFEQRHGSKIQSFFGTFRVISTNVTEGWIHPGYQPGAHLAEKANEHGLKVAGEIFGALASAGKKT